MILLVFVNMFVCVWLHFKIYNYLCGAVMSQQILEIVHTLIWFSKYALTSLHAVGL